MDKKFDIDPNNLIQKTLLVAMWVLKTDVDSTLGMQRMPIFMEVSNPKWESNRFIMHGGCQTFKLEDVTNGYYEINNEYLVEYLLRLHNSIIADALTKIDFNKDRNNKLIEILEDALIDVTNESLGGYMNSEVRREMLSRYSKDLNERFGRKEDGDNEDKIH